MAVCGAYAIRPYTGDLKNGDFSIRSTTAVAVCGAYAIRPYTGDLKNGDFSIRSTTGVAVYGAYAVAPYTGDLKNGDFSICSTSGVAVCGAYAIRPYTGDLKKWRFFCPFDLCRGRLWGVCCCALHGQTKTGLVFGSYFEEGRKRGRGVGCAKSGVGALP